MSAALAIVQRQVEAYNAHDLDAFCATFTDDVVGGAFNAAPHIEGMAALRATYAKTFATHPDIRVWIRNRIVHDPVVIDHEDYRRGPDDAWREAAALYAVRGDGIARLATVDGKSEAGAVEAVQAQLDAYNAQDVEAFCVPYADDCVLANFGGEETLRGVDALRASYAAMFARYPSNRAKLVNRIACGNVVFDHEEITREGTASFRAIAIFTVESSRITRVEFVK